MHCCNFCQLQSTNRIIINVFEFTYLQFQNRQANSTFDLSNVTGGSHFTIDCLPIYCTTSPTLFNAGFTLYAESQPTLSKHTQLCGVPFKLTSASATPSSHSPFLLTFSPAEEETTNETGKQYLYLISYIHS